LFGTAQIGPRHSRRHWRRLLSLAADSGFVGFDTAPVYADGLAEQFVADAIDRTPRPFVQTKVGLARRIPHRGWPRPASLVATAGLRLAGLSEETRPVLAPGAAEQQLRQSLSRLQLPAVDALLLHEPDPVHVTDELIDKLLAARARGELHALGVAGPWQATQTLLNRYPGVFTVIQLLAAELQSALDCGITRDVELRVHGLVRWTGHGTSLATDSSIAEACLAALATASAEHWPQVTPVVATHCPDRVLEWSRAWQKSGLAQPSPGA
jgi:hypothetical protein